MKCGICNTRLRREERIQRVVPLTKRGNIRYNLSKMLRSVFICFISGVTFLLWADPIVPTVINEVLIDQDSLAHIELKVEPGFSSFHMDSILTSREKRTEVNWDDGIFQIVNNLLINRDYETIEVYGMMEYSTPLYRSISIYPSKFPPGASRSLIWYQPDIHDYHRYWDFTPTFGFPNDDCGFVWGKVTDNEGKDLLGAMVKAVGPYDQDADDYEEWGERKYELALAVGKYYLTAEAEGYKTQVYPESVEIKDGDRIRIDFSLSPLGIEEPEIPNSAYINASSPSIKRTKITIRLPFSSYTNLKIYDALGRTVRVLSREERKAGIYTYLWDGCDDRGRRVSPGLYFVSLETGRFVLTRKFMLMR